MNKKGDLFQIVVSIGVWVLTFLTGIGFYLLFLFMITSETEVIQSAMVTESFQPTLSFLESPQGDLRGKEIIANSFRTNDLEDVRSLLNSDYSVDENGPFYWQLAVCSTQELIKQQWYLRRGKCFDTRRQDQGGSFQTSFTNSLNVQLPDRPYVGFLYAPSNFVEDDPFGTSTPP